MALQAIDKLKNLASVIRESGISALYLFGSSARGEANESSDVDLLFEVEPGRRFSLLDQAKLQIELSDRLGRPVDLVEQRLLRRIFRAGHEQPSLDREGPLGLRNR